VNFSAAFEPGKSPESGQKNAEKTPVFPAFFLPFEGAFGMLSHLSLGAPFPAKAGRSKTQENEFSGCGFASVGWSVSGGLRR
jgi:hypothetical protein